MNHSPKPALRGQTHGFLPCNGRLPRKSTGQSMVEWALILPALLLILMVIIDLGRVVYTYSALFNSVREGARYAIIHPTDSTGISATIRHMAVGLDPSLITVTPTYNATARTIQIVATYQFAVVTPFASTFLGSNRVTLHTQTTMRTEQ